jgi:hypothetical protein
MHCRGFLTHPVAPAVLCPSLREERGGGRLRARGELKRGKTQNILCLKHFQLTRRLYPSRFQIIETYKLLVLLIVRCIKQMPNSILFLSFSCEKPEIPLQNRKSSKLIWLSFKQNIYWFLRLYNVLYGYYKARIFRCRVPLIIVVYMMHYTQKVQSTEILAYIICIISVRCTLPAFINFFTTNILWLCRFLIAKDPTANRFILESNWAFL